MSVLSLLPPVLERYELKYIIPWHMVEEISDFISPFCSLDYHSVNEEENFYPVNSLYFDTRNFQFLQQRIYGKDTRMNMRVRSYADGKTPPYYMEIKHKISGVVKKYRATAQADEWPHLLIAPEYRVDEDDPQEQSNKELFLRLAISYAIEPKLLTRYKRRAFFSTVDDYARVTMDASMSYRLQDDYSLSPDDTMTHYDNETIYVGNMLPEGDSVILELKCNVGEVPT
ncbi:MAG: Unknown protein, partial [uncultured Thiotrichaceae bacterium]